MEKISIKRIQDLTEKYQQQAPRYTSYPTAVDWSDQLLAPTYIKVLKQLKKYDEELFSIYIHIPFCEERCLYCACNVSVRKDHSVSKPYLELLRKEIMMVSQHLGFKPKVAQLHVGGGTPTYFSPDELTELMAIVDTFFDLDYTRAELAIEIDPAVTTEAHLDTLTDRGFSRFSFGVQDFHPEVQKAVRRVQSFEDTYHQIVKAREFGAKSINVDLIYGLPMQTIFTFKETLEKTVALDPDRIALFSYAHVPHMHLHQQVLDQYPRPSVTEKIELLLTAREFFENKGYESVGMDHFAKPSDELFIAMNEGKLHRNFMGYTVQKTEIILGFGNSAIGEIAGTYFQNTRSFIEYEKKINAEELPIEKGYMLSKDDRIRRKAIMGIMVEFVVFFDEFHKQSGKVFTEYFSEEIKSLQSFINDGLVELLPDRLLVTTEGEFFVRNIAMVFDEYSTKRGEKIKFSSSV